MSSPDLDSKFNGIWLRALNEPSLENLTPELIVEWANSKGLANPVAIARGVGAFHPTPSIVLEVDSERLAFPKLAHSGIHRGTMGKIHEMLAAVRHCTNERAVEQRPVTVSFIACGVSDGTEYIHFGVDSSLCSAGAEADDQF
jgi:hypothetical protein